MFCRSEHNFIPSTVATVEEATDAPAEKLCYAAPQLHLSSLNIFILKALKRRKISVAVSQ